MRAFVRTSSEPDQAPVGAPRPAGQVRRTPGRAALPRRAGHPIGWPVTALINTVERPPPTTAAASAMVAERHVVPTRRSSAATTRLLTSARPKRGEPASSDSNARDRADSQPPPLMSVTQPAGAWLSNVNNQAKISIAGTR